MIDIKKSIEDARRAHRMQFFAHRQMLVDFYEGNQHEKDEYLKQYGFEDGDLPLTSDRLTTKVIDRISNVYKQPPLRSVVDESGGTIENHGYADFIADNPRFDQTWRKLERYRNLLHNVLLRPTYNKDRDMWWFYIEHEFYPHFDDDNAFCPVAYSIPYAQDTTSPNQRTETIYLYVSADEMFHHDEYGAKVLFGSEIPKAGMPNPLGIMPVIDFSPVTVDSYWSLGEKALVDKHRTLLVAEMNMWMGQHFQSFDQPYITGHHPSKDNPVETGANKIPLLDDGATFGLLGYNPKLMDSNEIIEAAIRRVKASYGLHDNTADSGDIASGVALKIKNSELLERREGDILEYRPKEQETYDLIAALHDYYNLGKFAEGVVKVDYSEIDFPQDEAAENAGWDWKFKHGFASKVDYLRSQNPDLTAEDAERILTENATANRQGRGIFSALTEERDNGDLEG